MINKKLSFEGKVEVSATQVVQDIYAYKKEYYVDGKLMTTEEGLALEENIRAVQSSQHDIEDVKGYKLFDKSFLEYIRTNTSSDVIDNYKEYLITNPYSYVSTNGRDSATPVNMNVALDGNYYNGYGKILPRAYHFDYLQSGLHDGNYNLEEVYELLKNRNDIKELSGIKTIPFDAYDDNVSKYISFIWTPNDEDFKVTTKHKLTQDKLKSVLHEVFQLPQPNHNY